jgi:hypothetical protein
MPGASGRKEGATYAPYVSGSVGALEKPRETRSWLMPVVVVAALVVLGLVAAGAYLVSNTASRTTGSAGSSGSTSSSQGQGSKLPGSASEEDKVREVVRVSNDEQIKAWRDLDEEVLKGTRVGKLLDENIDMVRQLKASNLYAIPVNERLDIVEVKVEGNKATARTIEVWTVTFFQKSDNKKVESRGPDTFTETYYLVKQEDGRWMINNLIIDGEGTPTTKG